MKVVKAFRFRVYPTPGQVARLGRWGDALRFLWNLALEQRLNGMDRPRGERVYPTAYDQMRELTELRAELAWLSDVPRDVCSQLLTELERAWVHCFEKRARAPRWKRRGRDHVSFCENHHSNWSIGGASVRFPKLGHVRMVIHRPIVGTPKTCRLVRDGDQWFACLTCEESGPSPILREAPAVGIDRGVANIVADSDGRIVVAPRHHALAQSQLARAQRDVSRKKKGSNNRAKAKARVAVLHRKVRRQREHFLHVLSSGYAKSHGVVVLEGLNVTAMVRGFCATGILDAGWGMLAEMLRYKLAWSGGSVVEVSAAYSSQACSSCGCVDAKSRASQSEFHCTSCGHEAHADVNAAKVLLQRYESARASRPGKPVEGIAPEATRRSRKRPATRTPRLSVEPMIAPWSTTTATAELPAAKAGPI